MRSINYKKKVTTANTQYNETTSWDLAWILSQSQRLIQTATDCEIHKVSEGSRLFTRNGNLPKQSSGKMNSPKSMCEGVLDNFHKGQYDLSDKQMQGIEESFKVANEIIEDFEQVEFIEGELPKLRSKLPAPLESALTTFESLFDNFNISINFTKK